MKYSGYLIDLDGTAYSGDTPIISCVNFVNQLNEHKIPFLFVSNNSAKTQMQTYEKLKKMGYNIEISNVYTSALATATYINENYFKPKCYVIGDLGINQALEKEAIKIVGADSDVCDIVVVGYDNKVDYQKLCDASNFLFKGSHFITTNPDRAIPTDDGFKPGNGAITELLKYATNIKPVVIGKPSTIIMDYAIKRLGVERDSIAMIGDNFDTDIMAGVNSHIDTVYVQTGLTTLAEINQLDIKPSVILNDLSEVDFNE